MKETKFYHTALEMSLLDGQDQRAKLDKRIASLAETENERPAFPWQKAVMTAAACLLLLLTVIIAIPSTRAEVLSWLGIITRPSEYLTADSSERPSIDALDKETLFTIHKFFENNLNVSETSRKLFVHRNTLVYRLEKIKKLTGLDLREFDDAITFKVALMVKKYLTSRGIDS